MHLPTENKFNLDTSKRAQEVTFSRKIKVTAHPQLASSTWNLNSKTSWNVSRFQAKFPRIFWEYAQYAW